MVALAFSLLLVTLCFKLPIFYKPTPVGWSPPYPPSPETFSLSEIWKPKHGVVTKHSSDKAAAEAATGFRQSVYEETPLPETGDTLDHWPVRQLHTGKLPVREFVEHMPTISGGIGAYYIHIDYPEEAIKQGIEGLLVLMFTVNENGSTSDVRVTRPLHPLCDSAAVRALRRTAFIPGQHDGEPVRVRMRLPVRFQLIDIADSTSVSQP